MRLAAAAFGGLALLPGTAFAQHPAEARFEAACVAFLAEADTFGDYPFGVEILPIADGASDSQGVRYEGGVDKLLIAGGGRQLPWGLRQNDGEAQVRTRLATLWPDVEIGWRADRAEPTLHAAVPGCDVWIEVRLENDRIAWVSLNAQP